MYSYLYIGAVLVLCNAITWNMMVTPRWLSGLSECNECQYKYRYFFTCLQNGVTQFKSNMDRLTIVNDTYVQELLRDDPYIAMTFVHP